MKNSIDIIHRFLYQIGKVCKTTQKDIIWNDWSTWTRCKYSSDGTTRRRFRDFSGLKNGETLKHVNNRECLMETIIDKDVNSTTRRRMVLYLKSSCEHPSEFQDKDIAMKFPRAVEIEKCKGKLFSICMYN